MLTLEDCIALSELTEGEIDAIAEHEHIPEIVAAELGAYLIHLSAGRQIILEMLHDDIGAAQTRNDHAHSAKLKLILARFIQHFPINTETRASDQATRPTE
jgi:hypothetical protein